MGTQKFDLIVIGSGPAGQKGAIQAAKLGKRVALIEKYPHLGGSSLNSGTIPSKSLREAILDLTEFYQKSYYAKEEGDFEVSISQLNYRLKYVLEHQREHLKKQFEKNHIEIITGTASFVDEHTLKVDDQTYSADYFLIATGSKPRNPTHVPFDKNTILDSTRLLDIDHVPKTLLVLGGGIIGSEYASFFAALGTEVTVIDRKEQMLPYLDREIGKHLQESLTDIGLKFVGPKEFTHIKRLEEGGAQIDFKDGSSLHGEMLLYALGRSANVDNLGIDNTGLTLDQKGYIPVNSLFQTVTPHIYAAGDVIGGPSLSATSFEQGRLAIRHAFGADTHHFPDFYPIGIYTIPEISSIGYGDVELIKMGFNYEIARNQIAGNHTGMFKILFHKDTLEILGIHIIGRGATEVIHIGQVAMTFNARIDYFIDQVFNYPTYAEGYRIAALNGMNKIKR